MIGFVDTPPRIEQRGGGFLVTVKSGDEETSFFLTFHALNGLCGVGLAEIKKAFGAKAATIAFPKRKQGRA